MFVAVTLAAVVAAAPAPVPPGPAADLPTAFWQITPEPFAAGAPFRRTKVRAAVLVHGLMVHPFHPEDAAVPAPHPWQHPAAELPKALAADFDVYGFAYAQTGPVDEVADALGLRAGAARLRQMGYRDVVLVGHSAGGLVARRFAERYPQAGVSKVIAVAAPFAGSGLARIPFGLPSTQVPFIRSLTPKAREDSPAAPLPDGMEFCCVVCKLSRLGGDTVVSAASQWPDELQGQGVPAALVACGHTDGVKCPDAVRTIAELAKNRVVRWTPDQVAQGRRVLFGESAARAWLAGKK